MKYSALTFILLPALVFIPPLPLHAAEQYQPVYLLPEESVEVKADVAVVEKKNPFLLGRYGFGLGLTDSLSLWYSVDYVSSYFGGRGVSGAGDSHPYLRWYIGGVDGFHAAAAAGMTVPSGGDLYRNVDWAGLSLGNWELFAGTLFRYDITGVTVNWSCRYVFRQGFDESFFSSRFFAPSRLRNDYCSASASVMSAHLYPLMMYAAVSASARVWKRTSPQDELPAEGCGFIPVPVSLGVRWFFSSGVYLGVYWTEELARRNGYPSRSIGSSFSILF